MVLKGAVVTIVIPIYLFGEDLVFCFVLALPEIFGSPEFCQIHFLLWFQTFRVMEKTQINKSKINFTALGQSVFSK